MIPLLFSGEKFAAIGSAALFWPALKALLVADLHLEKASFYARQGQMLPPYDSRATLDELAELVAKTGARRVFCLGDNYHDGEGEARLEGCAAATLQRLTTETDWLWITGNHDPDVSARFGGRVAREWTGGGIALRHEASAKAGMPEISGHYHPKIRVGVRGRQVSRRCFVRGRRHLILPAFGALTGGLDAAHPEIVRKIGAGSEALVPLQRKLARFALPGPETHAPVDDGQLSLALSGS